MNRETGWSWLLDAESRDDEILVCAIVDVAHDVATAAIQAGDLDQAATVVEVATNAAPLDEAVVGRSDDNLGLIDLP